MSLSPIIQKQWELMDPTYEWQRKKTPFMVFTVTTVTSQLPYLFEILRGILPVLHSLKMDLSSKIAQKNKTNQGMILPSYVSFSTNWCLFWGKKNKIQIHLSGDASQKGGGHVINSFSPSCRSFCLSSWFSLLSHGKDFSGRISTQSSNITVSELSSILVLKLTNHVFSKKKQISVCFKKNCS